MAKSYVQLFLGVFPPKLQHCTLAFVGKIDPFGAVPPTYELQSRVAARVFSGKLLLPSRDYMMKEANADITRRRNRWGDDIPRVSGTLR